MFTGIVEEIGTVKSISDKGEDYRIEIICKKVLEGSSVGDSISTNGVCLTISHIGENGFVADIMQQTLNFSNLGELRSGRFVNLERALNLEKRLGGHIVSGHIDTVGRIVDIFKEKNAIWFEIKPNEDIYRYIIEKGSVGIDGISLTIAKRTKHSFFLSIIPHTISQTILKDKKIGNIVNIEVDMIGKYVENILGENNDKDVDYQLLDRCGFL